MSDRPGDPPETQLAGATAMDVDVPVETGTDSGGQPPMSSTSPSDTVLCTPPTPGTPDLGASATIPSGDKVLSELTTPPNTDAVDEVSRRALARRTKGKRRPQGWKALPASILEYIFTLALYDIEPAGRLLMWREHRSWPVLLVLARARWLSHMRILSQTTRHVVDEHPFWELFIRVIDPQHSYLALQAVLDAEHGRPISSSRQVARMSLFRRAKRNTAHVCIPCRVNMPRLPSGRRLAQPEHTERHPQLGRIPICGSHLTATCDNCLQHQPTKNIVSPEINVDIGLCYTAKRQRNELGQRMTDESMICLECRVVILRSDVQAELRFCSRGGPVPTTAELSVAQMDEYEMMELSAAARRYLDHGELLSSAVAAHLINGLWLANHLGDVSNVQEVVAERLQDLEASIRRQLVLLDQPVSPEQHALWFVLAQKLAPPGAVDISDVQYELNNLYRSAIELSRNAVDRDDLVGALEDLEEDEEMGLSDRWKRGLRAATIEWWAWYRVMSGFWIMPSMEADLLATAVADSPSTALLPAVQAITDQNGDRGVPFRHPSEKEPLFCSPLGCIHLELTSKPRLATFLPPQKFARDELDQAFNTTLSRLVRPAMANLIHTLLESYDGDTVKTENVCAAQTFEQVMAALAETVVWTKGRYTRPLPPAIEHMAGDTMPTTEAEDYIVLDFFSTEDGSDVVETINDDPMHEDVAEGVTQSAPSLELSTDSLSSMGSRKRKSPTEDRFPPRKISKVEADDDGCEAATETPRPSDIPVPSPDEDQPASKDTLDAQIGNEISSSGSESDMDTPAVDTPQELAWFAEDPAMSSEVESDGVEVIGNGAVELLQRQETAATQDIAATTNGQNVDDDDEDEDDEGFDTDSEASSQPELSPEAYGHIGAPPVVPRIGPDVPAETLASSLIMNLWDNVRGKLLRKCRCKICLRAKRVEAHLEVLRSEAQSREGDADRQMAMSIYLGMLAQG